MILCLVILSKYVRCNYLSCEFIFPLLCLSLLKWKIQKYFVFYLVLRQTDVNITVLSELDGRKTKNNLVINLTGFLNVKSFKTISKVLNVKSFRKMIKDLNVIWVHFQLQRTTAWSGNCRFGYAKLWLNSLSIRSCNTALVLHGLI